MLIVFLIVIQNNQAPINVVGARELCEFGGTSEKHAIKQLLQVSCPLRYVFMILFMYKLDKSKI